jgi:deazaflavin-dependent oxidoreductase (nitroreductase family)
MAADPEFLYLTTTGRRSGQPREVELWFAARAGRYYVVAEHRQDAAWVQNLSVEPRVDVRVGDATFAARARAVPESQEPDLVVAVQELFERKYGWGEGLVVELTPLADA